MYDPVALARETERAVVQGDRRRYYRFRGARFYGGIATADCLGCCLRCLFCWGWNRLHHPGRAGKLWSPGQVAEKVGQIALRHGYHRARLSGNEPTLGRDHLLGLLGRLPRDLDFILETNGILLGHDPSYAEELAVFPLQVRVSLKGCSAEAFSALTGAEPAGFELQLRALEHLLRAGVACHAAVMVSFSPPRELEALRERLARIHPALAEIEEEEAFLNPAAQSRLRRAGIPPQG